MDVDPNWFISILYLSAVPSRAIQAEVAQKQNDEEHKVRWNVDVKQLVSELQEQAKKEFEDMAKSIPADEYEDSTTVPSSKSRQHGKKNGSKDRSLRSLMIPMPIVVRNPLVLSLFALEVQVAVTAKRSHPGCVDPGARSGLGLETLEQKVFACSIKAFGFTCKQRVWL